MQVSSLYAYSLDRHPKTGYRKTKRSISLSSGDISRKSYPTMSDKSSPLGFDSSQGDECTSSLPHISPETSSPVFIPHHLRSNHGDEASRSEGTSPDDNDFITALETKLYLDPNVSLSADAVSDMSAPLANQGNWELLSSELTHINVDSTATTSKQQHQQEVDHKELYDRLCKLPSQCKGGYILGSPRRPGAGINSTSRLCKSLNNLHTSSDPSLVKNAGQGSVGKRSVIYERSATVGPSSSNRIKNILSGPSSSMSNSAPSSPVECKKQLKKKFKLKDNKKDIKNLPSNFMSLSPWSIRLNSEKLLEQVRSGDVLEFNIKFHHHWGIALVNKNKSKFLFSSIFCFVL